MLTFCLQDVSTDNKSEEAGDQEGEKESTVDAVDDLEINFSAKKKKKKKKVCELTVCFIKNTASTEANLNVFCPLFHLCSLSFVGH